MIAVAVLVCLFAVGMAALLNYFKYRGTADRLVSARLSVISKSIENSIQASLAIGLSFNELATLPSLIERERTVDPLILEIKVFDTRGQPLYTTNPQGMTQAVPASWLAAARRGPDAWSIIDGENSAVGTTVNNVFGLVVGYVAVNYSRIPIDREAHAVGKELALFAIAIFAAAATVASLALNLVMRGLERDMSKVEAALQQQADGAAPVAAINTGPFGPALVRFFDRLKMAEVQIAEIRTRLGRAAKS